MIFQTPLYICHLYFSSHFPTKKLKKLDSYCNWFHAISCFIKIPNASKTPYSQLKKAHFDNLLISNLGIALLNKHLNLRQPLWKDYISNRNLLKTISNKLFTNKLAILYFWWHVLCSKQWRMLIHQHNINNCF